MELLLPLSAPEQLILLWHGDSPYQGDINEVTKPEEIAECVFYLLNQSDRTIYKRIILFPEMNGIKFNRNIGCL